MKMSEERGTYGTVPLQPVKPFAVDAMFVVRVKRQASAQNGADALIHTEACLEERLAGLGAVEVVMESGSVRGVRA
jgi:hypothetical protein